MMNTPDSFSAPVVQQIEAVVFDWAGTLVDFGSLAPTQIFVDALAAFDIHISLAQARGPMGLSKREHIRCLLQDPAILAQWQHVTGQAPGEADIDAIYARFMPMQIEKVGQYSQPVPGAVAVLAWLRSQGVKIGSCSGYPRQVMDVLLPCARAAGIEPDHVVAGDDLPAGGRPGPFMALANVLALGVSDVRACVKVDDTVHGIAEGRHAGMWSVGLALSGNEAGLTLDALRALDKDAIDRLRVRATRRLEEAGAHYVIDTIADLPQVVQRIQAQLAQGCADRCVSGG